MGPAELRVSPPTRAISVLLGLLLLASCAEFKLPLPGLLDSVSPKEEPVKELEADKAAIREIQAALNKLGFPAGPADGLAGQKTRNAIRLYERQHGLSVEGRPTRVLLSHIRRTLYRTLARPKRKRFEAWPEPAHEPESKEETVEQTPRPEETGLPMPSYEAGTVFVYQDGRVERVIGVSSGTVKWRRSDGTYFNTERNFLLPWSYWETKGQRGKVVLAARGSRLWPTAVGQKISYEAKVTVMDRNDQSRPRKSVEHWACANEGPERLTVSAGTFDTIRFKCLYVTTDATRSVTRIWHYASEIQHYIRFEERIASHPAGRRTELVAIRPAAAGWPPVMRAALERRLINALKNAPANSKVHWKSSGISTEVTVKLMSRFTDAKGRTCRKFIQIWSRNNIKRSYPGVACQNAQGRWKVPAPVSEETTLIAIASGRL